MQIQKQICPSKRKNNLLIMTFSRSQLQGPERRYFNTGMHWYFDIGITWYLLISISIDIHISSFHWWQWQIVICHIILKFFFINVHVSACFIQRERDKMQKHVNIVTHFTFYFYMMKILLLKCIAYEFCNWSRHNQIQSDISTNCPFHTS